jgi:hypothetical protein
MSWQHSPQKQYVGPPPAQANGGECDGFSAPAHGAIGDVDACCVYAIGPSWRASLAQQATHHVGCSSSRARSEHDPLGNLEIGAVFQGTSSGAASGGASH